MGSGNAKFLVGLGIGSAIGALVYHFSNRHIVTLGKRDYLCPKENLKAYEKY